MPQLTPAFSAAAFGLAYLLSLPVMCLLFAKEIARGGMDYVLAMEWTKLSPEAAAKQRNCVVTIHRS